MAGQGAPLASSVPTDYSRKDVVQNWDPENPEFWQRYGKRTATRNLAVSIAALLLSFVVNTLCALVSSQLGNAGFSFEPDQLFLLTALPGLVGATGRLFYTYCPAVFGGRNFTFASTAIMLVPLVGLGMAVQDSATPFWQFALWFAFMGLALSNFSASMANIAYFFPIAHKGTANGLNAGIGNLGVAVAYFVTPIVIGRSFGLGAATMTPAGESLYLHNACFVWVAPIVVVLVLVALFMDNLPMPRQSASQMATIFKNKHTWYMTVVYTCSFGSFIGYSMALALIVGLAFPEVDARFMMFLGPLIGAGLRPVGGWLSDRIDSGARVAFASFVVMLAATIAVIAGVASHAFAVFFGAFLVLFMMTGLANGASFRMIPNIFTDRAQGSQVVGFTAAIAAYGAFVVPILFRADYVVALVVLAIFTALSAALTWIVYARKNAPMPC